MRYGISLVALLFALSVGTAPLFAQGRGNGQAKKPTAHTTQGSGKNSGAKADRPKPASGKKATVTTTKNTEISGKGNPNKRPKVKAKEVASVKPTTPVTPTTPTTQHVKNPKLEARLLALLPSLPPGTTIQQASAGFKNWGQFVAAVHVSNNLNIPFADLKARMTGITPGPIPGTVVQTTPLSLGQAIQSFKGVTTNQIQTEVKKAEDAANADLRRTRDSN